MQTEFLDKFSKDLDKIDAKSVKTSVLSVILNVEESNSIADIKNIKKLKGHSDAYRIRIGDYRIGLFIKEDIAIFARIVHRKDIYKVFP